MREQMGKSCACVDTSNYLESWPANFEAVFSPLRPASSSKLKLKFGAFALPYALAGCIETMGNLSTSNHCTSGFSEEPEPSDERFCSFALASLSFFKDSDFTASRRICSAWTMLCPFFFSKYPFNLDKTQPSLLESKVLWWYVEKAREKRGHWT